MQFNEKLKKLRAEKGISQAELASKIFVSRSAVAKWENGLGLPNEQSLNMLAEYFGLSTSALLSDPQTENVIVSQNGTLSRQKGWIIALAALLFVCFSVASVLTVFFLTRPKQPVVTAPVITRELIFETEKMLSTEHFVNYQDEDISVEKTFAPGRIFELSYEQYVLELPLLLVKTTANGVIAYEAVRGDSLVFSCSENICLQKDGDDRINVCTISDPIEFEAWVNIKYGELILSFKVFKNRIPVESFLLKAGDGVSDTIGLTQSVYISAVIEPYNASYRSYALSVDRIVKPDGTEYEGEFSTYVILDNTGNLTITDEIEIGSSVYLSGTTYVEDVKSDPLILRVVRIPVEEIEVRDLDYSYTIGLGESLRLLTVVRPNVATFNVLNEEAALTLLTPETGTLEKTGDGWILTATEDKGAVGGRICIKAEIDGISRSFEWTIEGIAVKSITVTNAETGKELDEITYMTRNGTMQLQSFILPENATYQKVNYNVAANVQNFGRYVSVTDEGVLKISEMAPFDLEVYVSASTAQKSSKVYKIIVREVAVESVVLSCDTVKAEIGKTLHLSVTYAPENADMISIEYVLLEEVEGVYVSGNMIYISDNAEVGVQIRVQAIVNGVSSNILTFTIADE